MRRLPVARFRKKPVVVEAIRVGSIPHLTLAAWCGGSRLKADGNKIAGILIPTLEGVMRADHGDWIIKGVQGEFYPCKPDIFEATYEKLPFSG